MAEELITAIRTNKGVKKLAYSAIGDAPKYDVSISTLSDRVGAVEKKVENIEGGMDSSSITINGQTYSLSEDINLDPSDIEAAPEVHEHNASHITAGSLPMERGGTNAGTGHEGLKNLFNSGHTILSQYQFGTATPTFLDSEKKDKVGCIFFVKVSG